MQRDPFTQAIEARLAAMRHHLRAVENGFRAARRRAVPDIATLHRLAAERERLAGEIARHEGVLRALFDGVSPVPSANWREA